MEKKTKILICGDSFAADWTIKTKKSGWVNFLKDTDIIAQAGVGEYKILKQLQSCKLELYTHIIISHTSPYRIHTITNPLHINDSLHYACDFIYDDVKDRLPDVEKFFTDYFDLDYSIYVHTKICEDIDKLTKNYKTIHMNHVDWKGLYKFKDQMDFSKLKKSVNNSNHYDEKNNMIVYNKVLDRI